jgi:hypothetical protein
MCFCGQFVSPGCDAPEVEVKRGESHAPSSGCECVYSLHAGPQVIPEP